MKVVDTWNDHGDLYFTVELEDAERVDVKHCGYREENGAVRPPFSYVMQCDNGYEAYRDGKGIRHLEPIENAAVMALVNYVIVRGA